MKKPTLWQLARGGTCPGALLSGRMRGGWRPALLRRSAKTRASDMFSYLINRAALRSRLLRLKPIAAFRRRASAARRRAFRATTGISPAARTVSAGVKEKGVHLLPEVTPLLGPGASVIAGLIARGSAAWDWAPGRDLLESDDILVRNADVYALGLDAVLLDLAEDYLGEPCFYMGCSLKRERVSPSKGGTRQWHHDIEDDRLLRLIFYLNDVEEGGGPFQYIDVAASRLAGSRLAYRSGYVGDAAMRSAIRDDSWTSVRGGAGLMIAFDGTRVFHRVSPPVSADRFSLSITYSSRHPRQILRQVRLRPASRRRLLANLSDRERACLPGARWS